MEKVVIVVLLMKNAVDVLVVTMTSICCQLQSRLSKL